MPRLRTDDGPRKLRAVWLGPAGHTLPFQWTYVQWAVTLIAVPVAGTIGTAIVWFLLHDPVWAFGIGGLWFGAAGLWLAVRLMRNVTFDEPLRYQRRLVRGEFNRSSSTPVGPRAVAVQFTVPPMRYLSEQAQTALGWTGSDQRPLSAGRVEVLDVDAMPAARADAPREHTEAEEELAAMAAAGVRPARPVRHGPLTRFGSWLGLRTKQTAAYAKPWSWDRPAPDDGVSIIKPTLPGESPPHRTAPV